MTTATAKNTDATAKNADRKIVVGISGINATDNPGPGCAVISPENAALKIIKGVEAKQERIVFPWQTHFIVKALSFLPAWMQARILDRQRTKPVDGAIPDCND